MVRRSNEDQLRTMGVRRSCCPQGIQCTPLPMRGLSLYFLLFISFSSVCLSFSPLLSLSFVTLLLSSLFIRSLTCDSHLIPLLLAPPISSRSLPPLQSPHHFTNPPFFSPPLDSTSLLSSLLLSSPLPLSLSLRSLVLPYLPLCSKSDSVRYIRGVFTL